MLNCRNEKMYPKKFRKKKKKVERKLHKFQIFLFYNFFGCFWDKIIFVHLKLV